MADNFRKFAESASNLAGAPGTFASAALAILVWGCLGPAFNYSDTWQLVVNTGTTVVTFLMVFLIQHTQNRDIRAVHLKLDELIRASSRARNELINLQALSDQELDRLHEELSALNQETEERIHQIQKTRASKGGKTGPGGAAPLDRS